MEILNFHQMSWQEGWEQFEKPCVKGDISSLISKTDKMIEQADSKEKVIELINIYEEIIKIDPTNRKALIELYSFCFLVGYGYADNKEEKKEYFLKTIKYSEQFMYSNPEFKLLADKGDGVWEACRVLSVREMEAMSYWYMSVGLYWKECQGVGGKLINIQWPIRIKKVIVRMMEIDPTWLNGVPYYLWANYYANAPGIVGGDLKKAEEYYKKAIELGPNMLNYRRSRSYYLYTKKKDRESFKRDLEWVISQDPHKAGLSYPWNAFIQHDAKNGLANINNYFR